MGYISANVFRSGIKRRVFDGTSCSMVLKRSTCGFARYNMRCGCVQIHHGEVPRVEKESSWSALNKNSQPMKFTAISTIEIHDEQGQWVMAATSEIYDSATGELLFRTTSSTVVVQVHSTSYPSCLFRTHYRVHEIDCSTAGSASGGAGGGDSIACPSGSHAKALAIDSWTDKMRKKDRNMQRLFMSS